MKSYKNIIENYEELKDTIKLFIIHQKYVNFNDVDWDVTDVKYINNELEVRTNLGRCYYIDCEKLEDFVNEYK